jgi:oligopeptide transport system substrate-binding protein
LNSRRGSLAQILPLLGICVTTAVSATDLGLGIAADPESLDPALISGVPDYWLDADLFEGLTTYDADGKVIAGVATTWESSADGKRWVFHLRPDARWSDGSLLTAADFVYTFRRAAAPATASPYAAALSPILNAREVVAGRLPTEKLGVTATDALTVSFELIDPTPFFPEMMTLPVTFPVKRGAVEKYGEKWSLPGNLIGNGAYMLVSWTPGSEIVLQRNTRFHAVADVKLDRVHYLVDEDKNAGFKRYLAGEIDETLLAAADVRSAERLRPAEYTPEPLPSTEHLVVNMARSPLGTSPKLRRAISLAIDREALATKVDPRGGVPSWTFVPAGLGGYVPPTVDDAALKPADRVKLAKQLFSEAMAEIALDPQHFTLHLSTYKDDIAHRIVQATAAMLRATLGIDVELEEPEWRVWDSEFHGGNFDIVLYEWTADYDDPWSFLSGLRSDAGLLNPGRYGNPEYDSLTRQSGALPPAERLAMLAKAERVLLADAPVIPLERDVMPYLISPHLKGWHPNAMDSHPVRFMELVE